MIFLSGNSIKRKFIINIVFTLVAALVIFTIGIVAIRVVNVCLVMSKAERDHTVNYWLAYSNLEKYMTSGNILYYEWSQVHLEISLKESYLFSTVYTSLETKPIDEIAREFAEAFPSANYGQCCDMVIVVKLLPSNKIIQSLVENTRKGYLYALEFKSLSEQYRLTASNPERLEIFRKITEVNALMNDETNLFSDGCDQLSEWAISLVTKVMIATILVMAVIVTFFIVKLIRPINNLIKASTAMSQGDLDYELSINSNDEVGLLADSFSQMRDAIGEKIDELEAEINERKIAEKALRKSEEKYRILVEAADDAIILTDTKFNHILTNNAFYSRLGYENGDDMGPVFSRAHPNDVKRLQKQQSELFERGKGTYEFREMHKDGHWINCYATSVVIIDDNGNPTGVLSIIRDITEQRRLEEQLQIREHMDSIGTLAGGIAHDFNNLLTSIIGNLDMVRIVDRDNLTPKQSENLNNAQELCLRSANLIKNFQSLSSGSVSKRSNIDLYKIADEVLTFLSRSTDNAIEKKIDFNEDMFFINGHEDQIHQVFMNIGLNAIQAIEDKGAAPGDTICISAREDIIHEGFEKGLPKGTYIHLSFSDSGCGMTEEVKKRVFDPLFSTKERSTQKGQGLGLAIVYNIITRNHKGLIEIETEVDGGSTFHIYLPEAEKNEPVY